ncbi:MAG: DUF2971 domain-containing protein [Alphaproteobacteria bacterium]
MELWHYTDLNAARSILKTGELWLTDINSHTINDEKEGDWARHVLQEYFEGKLYELVKEKITDLPEQKLRELAAEEIKDRLEILFKKALWDKDNLDADFKGFILSLSKDNPEHGLLSMWRGYGGKQPVALVFDGDALIRTIKSSFYDDKYLLNFPVYYARKLDDVIYQKDINDYLNILEQTINHLDFQERPKENDQKVFLPILQLAMRIKHQGFQEEQEYRICFTIVTDPELNTPEDHQAYENYRKNLRIEKKSDVDRLIISLDGQLPKVLKKLVIGPAKNQDEIVQPLKPLRNKLGYGIQIIKSDIPFKSNT